MKAIKGSSSGRHVVGQKSGSELHKCSGLTRNPPLVTRERLLQTWGPRGEHHRGTCCRGLAKLGMYLILQSVAKGCQHEEWARGGQKGGKGAKGGGCLSQLGENQTAQYNVSLQYRLSGGVSHAVDVHRRTCARCSPQPGSECAAASRPPAPQPSRQGRRGRRRARSRRHPTSGSAHGRCQWRWRGQVPWSAI